MSGKAVKRRDQSCASNDDTEGHAPPKRAKAAAAKNAVSDDEDSDDIIVCEISKNRRVSVRNWNGRIWVDIREFYVKDGQKLPTKKGISLSVDQWNTLRDHIEEIDTIVAENS